MACCFLCECYIATAGLLFWLGGSLLSFVVAVDIVTGAGLYTPPAAVGVAIITLLTLPLVCLVLWWVVAHLKWVD